MRLIKCFHANRSVEQGKINLEDEIHSDTKVY